MIFQGFAFLNIYELMRVIKISEWLTRFRTPTIRRSILGTTPRTPTPFKNALAAQEKKYGPLKIVVCILLILKHFLVLIKE